MKLAIRTISHREFSGGYDSRVYVTSQDILQLYKNVKDFLDNSGKAVKPQRIQHLPYIQSGVITSANVDSTYILDSCLIENKYVPAACGIDSHEVVIGGESKQVRKVAKRLESEAISKHIILCHHMKEAKLPEIRKYFNVPLNIIASKHKSILNLEKRASNFCKPLVRRAA